MIKDLDFSKEIDKTEYKTEMAELEIVLGNLQRKAQSEKIPIMIVFEGYGASGKGRQIGELIKSLDARGYKVKTIINSSEEEQKYPFIYRFWQKIPPRGEIAIFDSSWYRTVLNERFDKNLSKKESEFYYRSIKNFEKNLVDDEMIIVKLFLAISKEEQKRRFHNLLDNPKTAWRVNKGDLARLDKFALYTKMIDEMLEKTDFSFCNWKVIPSNNRRYATLSIYKAIIQTIDLKLNSIIAKRKNKYLIDIVNSPLSNERPIEKLVLDQEMSKEDYKDKLKIYQRKIRKLHNELYVKKIPVVIAFEGSDAAGKGGAIKRLVEKMDPRGFDVNTTAKPTYLEYQYNYLWRFWTKMPKKGHIAIFDRTWYGRVMVERIEGFATGNEWRRAYKEINDMEKDLTDSGWLVIKFWLQISKDEQEKRFVERQNNPQKRWKITDEDWRNREKWDLYKEAVNEMLQRTNTSYAPWTLVEGNNKYYARLKVIETVINNIEKRLKEEE